MTTLTLTHRALLQKAHDFIEEERFLFICTAVEEAAFVVQVGTRPERFKAARELTEYITGSLCGFASVTGYAEYYFNIGGAPGDDGPLRELRLEWIDWMLTHRELPPRGGLFLYRQLRTLYWGRRKAALRAAGRRFLEKLHSLYN